MQPNILNFNTNWNNKLQCNYFTSIRLHNKNRFEGLKVMIQLKNECIHTETIVKIENCTLSQIGDRTAYLDTGYNRDGFVSIFHTMYKNKNIDWDKQILDVLMIKRDKDE
ncbi:MAG: hypothetical protein ACOYO1_18870 [Bacteroidales bacterium]